MPNRDNDTWLPVAEATVLLGISERGLQRRVAAGVIRRKELDRQPGQSAATPVFSQSDIQALLRGSPMRYPPPARRMQYANWDAVASPALSPRQLAAPVSNDPEETGDDSPALATARDTSRPWLTLAQAAEYSGLPASWLLVAAADGTVPALDVGIRPGGRWRFHRESLGVVRTQWTPNL